MHAARLALQCVVIVLFCGSLASAANRMNRNPARATRPVQTAAVHRTANMNVRGTMTSTGDVQTLRQAYQILSTANHDYQGHRVKAMHSIRLAARHMGAGNLGTSGKGSGHEQQTLSDEQLREVQGMLQRVKGTVTGRSQMTVVGHLDRAIQQLSEALAVK